jgi:allophanate hydrolase subunit 1
MVLLRFADATDAAVAKAKLESLVGVVPAIRSMQVVLDALGSPTGHHLALLTRHDDEAGLRAYQQHPAHVEVGAWLKAHETDRAVVDAVVDPVVTP